MEFEHPLMDYGRRADNQDSAARVACHVLGGGLCVLVEAIGVELVDIAIVQPGEKGHDLHGFAKAHLIADNSASARNRFLSKYVFKCIFFLKKKKKKKKKGTFFFLFSKMCKNNPQSHFWPCSSHSHCTHVCWNV